MSDLLLDTCAVIWLAQGAKMAADARRAAAESELHVSPITVWEIANLVRKNRLALTLPVTTWFRQTVDEMQAAVPELSIDILATSCALPGIPPEDPADRIIIATARETGLIVMTRDSQILAYSQSGHVRTMAC